AAFVREATWGAGLKHPQLARVLGLSLLEPPCAALDRGDSLPLPSILRMEQRFNISADGSRVAIRWMSWENLLLGMCSTSSDVWSFGVTVWEILTLCRARPFDEMNDDQVVMNATQWRKGVSEARVPTAPPPRCRRELYDIMHECWRREPAMRPRFHDLHRFLSRMSKGSQHPLPR
ncbi:unnamed protein product, partial [Leptidea sinapis]